MVEHCKIVTVADVMARQEYAYKVFSQAAFGDLLAEGIRIVRMVSRGLRSYGVMESLFGF
ncbi:hypothetical protein ACMFMG_001789 [Clarireedia jacksonii]